LSTARPADNLHAKVFAAEDAPATMGGFGIVPQRSAKELFSRE